MGSLLHDGTGRPTSTGAAVPGRPGAGALRAGGWLLAAAVVLGLLVVLRWAPLMALDRAVAGTLHRAALASPAWTGVNRVLTDWVWDPWTMRVLLAALVGWLLWRGVRMLAAWVAATSVTGTLFQQGVKAAVDRPRPVWPDPVDSAHYAAFPSGHALTAAVAGAVALWMLRHHDAPVVWRRVVGALATVSVLGVGFTRLFLGVHWLSDVLAGWLLGGALVALAVGLHARQAVAATSPPAGTTDRAAPTRDG